ncbi:ABC transporter substrate-binding protein [Ectothiorhodospiraceae bacterium WFHF3C12]|nr:ABC transporter substrate-binding protein [Ectothiorhodospiraceae bacterium WFHF3C12]
MSIRKQLAVMIWPVAAAAMMVAGSAGAQDKEEIVIGASVPMTGPFAFAGIQFNRGINDYVEWVNSQGGIRGRQVRYIGEDTGYDADQSVAVFRRITSSEDVTFYFGDSTAFQQSIEPELERRDILMTGASFASEINNPEEYPMQFLLGPDYGEQVGILLEYIADENPGASVAFIHSDTEFGRDPIEGGKKMAEDLGLEVATTIVTPPGSADVSAAALELRRARPDYAIMHGYVLSPIPAFIEQARQMRLDTRFMGTIYTMEQGIIDQMGETAEGFLGVMPYRYYYDENADEAPLLQTIREMHDEYQATTYTQGWVAGILMQRIAEHTLDAGRELNGTNMRKSIEEMENIDTGGLIGKKFSFSGNSIPVGRIYRADVSEGRMVPVSDWIELD